MKLKHFFIGAAALLAVTACEEELPVTPVLNIDKASVTIASTEGWASFNLIANSAWNATSDVDWITLDPANGSGSEDAVNVKITAEDNPVNAERTAVVTVISGDISKTLNITQVANQNAEKPEPEPEPEPVIPSLTVDKDALKFEYTGGDGTFNITSNVAWTAASDVDWITLEPAGGDASASAVAVTVRVEENPDMAQRSAVITLTGEGMEAPVTLPVDQDAKPAPVEDGTEANPYLIESVDEIVNMKEQVVSGGTVYFSLQNDIDMSSVTEWVPVNAEKDMTCKLHFNGNGHTISNLTASASFFGLLSGSCINVVFDNAVITAPAAYCGLLADTVYDAVVKNCHATGLSLNSTLNYVGGLAGNTEGTCSFARCSVAGKVTGAQLVGGLIGDNEGTLTVSDSYTTCEITTTNQIAGGILGRAFYSYGPDGDSKTPEDNADGNVLLERCYSSGVITATRAAAGIAGIAHTSALVIKDCIAWNPSVNATNAGAKHYYSGAIRGGSAASATVGSSGCMRRSDLVITAYAENLVSDSEDEASAPGAVTVPYHGKAASAGATLSSVASSIGWSSDVWDMSGEMPVISVAE
ncbi:MAG: BACON domain-containing protein [Bacteroidales bacterium]|nr:BACON domain-containing protein [Bacteroidales bacterium]